MRGSDLNQICETVSPEVATALVGLSDLSQVSSNSWSGERDVICAELTATGGGNLVGRTAKSKRRRSVDGKANGFQRANGRGVGVIRQLPVVMSRIFGGLPLGI